MTYWTWGGEFRFNQTTLMMWLLGWPLSCAVIYAFLSALPSTKDQAQFLAVGIWASDYIIGFVALAGRKNNATSKYGLTTFLICYGLMAGFYGYDRGTFSTLFADAFVDDSRYVTSDEWLHEMYDRGPTWMENVETHAIYYIEDNQATLKEANQYTNMVNYGKAYIEQSKKLRDVNKDIKRPNYPNYLIDEAILKKYESLLFAGVKKGLFEEATQIRLELEDELAKIFAKNLSPSTTTEAKVHRGQVIVDPLTRRTGSIVAVIEPEISYRKGSREARARAFIINHRTFSDNDRSNGMFWFNTMDRQVMTRDWGKRRQQYLNSTNKWRKIGTIAEHLSDVSKFDLDAGHEHYQRYRAVLPARS